MDRRQFSQMSLTLGALTAFSVVGADANEAPEWNSVGVDERDRWMGAVMGTKSFDAPGVYSKFSDGMFYLQAPLPWKPNQVSSPLSPVTVPKGFVTDLTSIPRPFWSIIPRDGDYADAAIVHDYLYWMQTGTREEADSIFKLAMEDLEVHPAVVSIIFRGVRSVFGERAWDKNAVLRRSGESRLLAKYPPNSGVKWEVWKRQTGNIVPAG
jgi:hypothetical protein